MCELLSRHMQSSVPASISTKEPSSTPLFSTKESSSVLPVLTKESSSIPLISSHPPAQSQAQESVSWRSKLTKVGETMDMHDILVSNIVGSVTFNPQQREISFFKPVCLFLHFLPIRATRQQYDQASYYNDLMLFS